MLRLPLLRVRNLVTPANYRVIAGIKSRQKIVLAYFIELGRFLFYTIARKYLLAEKFFIVLIYY
ncbi:MAG: hypothetical protein COT32_02165 [Candidatus Nealsonbacteria bacterium CG08_land_8_20_14_0_20_36_22]|uniref:Uncharacterized protein n=1 Tax=Candidatus Nealsonbacteria bacterium CG08_land_8_20_14_0_20_36_22 TaxID=1974704 RepID=A0A2H0YNJ2_9BACT|nr:MAG: hypothetical protein COT32_02165 [Candidatus Nealsonbacteria bacterium CG08_land_8_20_14_0_20_36_22]